VSADAEAVDEGGGREDEPEIDEEDVADIPDDMADELADVAAPDESDEGGSESGGEDEELDPSLQNASIGNTYCKMLGMVGGTVAANYDADADRESEAEEYEQMARQLDLDALMDRWVAEAGGVEELPPGQAVLVSTGLFGGLLVVDHPELADDLLNNDGGDE
jgi:hypothetical protein